MAIKYVLTTTTPDNKIVVADQIPANSITSAQVDGSIALQSALDAAIKGMAPKGSVRTILELPDLTNTAPTPSFTWNGDGQTLTSTTNFTLVGVAIGGVSDLANGDKVLVSFSSADKQYAGIYVITSVGEADVSPVILTRAANFNETAEVSFGAYVVVNAGTYANQIWYLKTEGAITLNTTPLTFELWGGTGSTYTAGNGISINGGNEIAANLLAAGGLGFGAGGDSTKLIVKVAASNALLKNDSSGELSVRTASSSVSGVITSTQFKDLTRTVAASTESASSFQTTGNGYSDFAIPVTPENTVVLVRAVVHSLSTVSAKHCVTEVRFALRRSTGASVAIGSTLQVFKEGDASGITAMTIEGRPGADGADVIRVTGVDTFTINHFAVVTTQHLPNALSIA